jgi:ribosomal protein L29
MNRSVLARQMFANGGQAVPNEYKGFSMLPEEVQMKMDPAAAKKYEEGGEIRAGISEELRRDIDRVKAQLIEERMQQQRQTENVNALRGIRNLARYDTPVLGLDDVSKALPANEDGFNPNNIYNIARFFGENPGTTVSDYNEFFQTNLDPRDFSVLEEKAEPPAVGMAMGGDPAMAQGVGSMMPPPPDMPPAPPPMEGGQAIDPQVLEGALATAEQEITNLDQAEDFETVMNTIRGDEATVEERYEELAGVVGEEDARQTPESVLTLVQPAMVMGAVDQGIGGLAQQEMMEPVQGAMAQGIMSNVAPPPPPAAPMPPGGMGGPPPANFKEGGLVRRGDNQPVLKFSQAGVVPGGDTSFLPYLLRNQRFTTGSDTPLLDSAMAQNIADAQNQAALGASQAAARAALSPAAAAKLPKPEPTYDERVLAAAEGAQERYAAAGLGTAEERAAELESQKDLTKAQMLFDIAQTALTFAGPMQGERPGASAAERLAMAASATKLPQTIGARAQTLAEQKQAADKEERALKLAAVQRGETQVDAEIASEQAIKLAKVKTKPPATKLENLVGSDGNVIGTYDVSQPKELVALQKAQRNNPGSYVGTPPKPKTGVDMINVLSADGRTVLGSFDQNKADDVTRLSKVLKENKGSFTTTGMPRELKTREIVLYDKKSGAQSPIFDVGSPEGRKQVKEWEKANPAPDGGSYVELRPAAAPSPDRPISSRDVFMKFGYDNMEEFNKLPQVDQDHLRGLDVVTPRDFFLKFGMDEINFGKLSKQDQRIKMGLPTLTDKDYLQAYDMTKAQFLALTPEEQNRKMGLVLDKELRVVNNQLVVYDPATDGVSVAFGKPKAQPYKPMKIIKGGKETVVDVNTEAGRKAVEDANEDDTARVVNVGTEVKPKAKSFLIPGTGLVSSYDGGQTYIDAAGNIQDIPQGPNAAFPLSDRTSYDIFRRESIRSDAKERIRVAEDAMTRSLTRPDGSIVSSTDSGIVANALMAARNATGPYANFAALMDGVIAGAIPSETARNFFKDTQDNRQFIRALKVLGSSALSVSPRMAVYDLARVERLFPDPDAIFRNPISEANKLVVLKQIIIQQKTYNDQNLAAGIDDATLRSEVIRKNYEIDRLLGLLEGVDAGGGGLNQEAQAQLMDDILAGRN